MTPRIERSGSLPLRGGGFRRRCEQIPAAGRLRENALQVLRQQVASVDQALRRVTYLIEVGGLAGIACRDRPARVAFAARWPSVAGNGIVDPIRLISCSGAPIWG